MGETDFHFTDSTDWKPLYLSKPNSALLLTALRWRNMPKKSPHLFQEFRLPMWCICSYWFFLFFRFSLFDFFNARTTYTRRPISTIHGTSDAVWRRGVLVIFLITSFIWGYFARPLLNFLDRNMDSQFKRLPVFLIIEKSYESSQQL